MNASLTEVPDASMLPSVLHVDPRAGQLRVEWPDGARDVFTHDELRACCPCASCRQTRRTGQTVPRASDIRLTGVVPYGPGAVQLTFSDGHARGIYPFAYLRRLRTAHAAR